MKKLFVLLLSAIVIASVLLLSFGETPSVKKATVKDVIENATLLDKNDEEIILTGTISSQISKKKFWFEDNTGQIIIEVKNSLIPLVPSTNQIEVEIRGKVDCQANSGDGIKIDVKDLSFDQDEDIQLM
ncbi:MAG: NirD/YgiW/YdeI family stress tolerance protein [Bacteroidales bacterium]|nr:NirD/YgiW/YdeI family stress tolerance protein [Bacteroidales bacterium]